jgi:hypothetical protein
MRIRKTVERLREGDFVAEVEVELLMDDPPDSGWGPYLSLADARKVETVREALRKGDVAAASAVARVYRLLPVSAA